MEQKAQAREHDVVERNWSNGECWATAVCITQNYWARTRGRKLNAQETCGRCLSLKSHHAVVASVASVMANHGPANTDRCRDEDGGNRIPWQLTHAGPGKHHRDEQKYVKVMHITGKRSFEIGMAVYRDMHYTLRTVIHTCCWIAYVARPTAYMTSVQLRIFWRWSRSAGPILSLASFSICLICQAQTFFIKLFRPGKSELTRLWTLLSRWPIRNLLYYSEDFHGWRVTGAQLLSRETKKQGLYQNIPQ